jgi:phosphatidylcholine synthase
MSRQHDEATRNAHGPLGHVSASAKALAWAVHAFTASSAVFALLALAAIERDAFRESLLWLLAALAVDGVDGTLARAVHIKTRAPRIDGETLDLIVDYLTYVFVPTMFIWRAGLVPEPLAFPLAAAIQLSALYLFTRRDMKTDDNYFRGFPALWNVIAFYLFVSGAGPAIGAVTVAAFVAMTFAPVHFVHPFRVREFQPWLPVLATAWAAATAALLWPGWSDWLRGFWLGVSLASGALLLVAGLLRTVRGDRSAVEQRGRGVDGERIEQRDGEIADR